jgi:altronate hydrolase
MTPGRVLQLKAKDNVLVAQRSEQILDHAIQFASGEARTKAEQLAQNDVIPWKRGVSL